jgi:hypothetical protein
MRPIALSVVLALCAAPAVAQDLRTLCQTSAGIAAAAAEARLAGGTTQAQVVVNLQEANEAPAVQLLVPEIAAWVWTLPEDQLDPAAIEAAFVEQCLAQGTQ